MAHFKRKGPKSTRAGCLMCKPHKDQRRKDCWESQSRQEQKARIRDRDWDQDLGKGAGSE